LPSSERIALIASAAVVVLLVGYAVYSMASVPGSVTGKVPTSFSVNGRSYTFTYIATTQDERETGLMNKPITNTTTMLFAFPSPISQPFWMYHTNTSLDMIWVNAAGDSGNVVYVQDDAQPCPNLPCQTYPSSGNAPLANYVIEAKAGFAGTNGILVGTTIVFA